MEEEAICDLICWMHGWDSPCLAFGRRWEPGRRNLSYTSSPDFNWLMIATLKYICTVSGSHMWNGCAQWDHHLQGNASADAPASSRSTDPGVSPSHSVDPGVSPFSRLSDLFHNAALVGLLQFLQWISNSNLARFLLQELSTSSIFYLVFVWKSYSNNLIPQKQS